MEYTKNEAIAVAKNFIEEVNKLENRYGMMFNSDTNDIYLSFKTKDVSKTWDSISLGWDINGNSGIKVIEEIKDEEKIRESALNKLTPEEREVLGV